MRLACSLQRVLIAMLIVAIGRAFIWPESLAAHEGLKEQIAAITAQLSKDPNNVELLARRAELLRLGRQWNDSLRDLERAWQLDSTSPAAELVRARLHLDSGNAKASFDASSRVLMRDASNL